VGDDSFFVGPGLVWETEFGAAVVVVVVVIVVVVVAVAAVLAAVSVFLEILLFHN